MYGNLILAICVAGACLTTAIGLVATVGEFFSSITSFKYENIVIFTVIISFLLSILGVESIIRISVPILIYLSCYDFFNNFEFIWKIYKE